MVKTLPTVERSTQIRFGKHAQQDQGENTIVLNASNTAVDASTGGAVYVSPVRYRPDYEGNSEIVLMMYNTTTKELTQSGESAQDVIGNQGFQAVTNQGNTTSNNLIFYNNVAAFVTTGNVGIANSLASHTLSVGSNVYIDDTGINVLVASGGVGITDTTSSTSATTGALKVAGGISTEENLNVGGATDASSKTTGALIVTGGVGISKNIHALHANFEDVEADSVTITDTTTSSSETTGALKVAGGISTQENLNVGGVAKVISATDASSKTTGALIVSGGVGISKNIHALNANFEDVEADSVNITDTTPSNNQTTGALKVAGGLGVAGNVHCGNLTLTGNLTVTGNTTVFNSNNLVVQDAIIELGKGNLAGLDTGLVMNNPTTGGNKGNVAMIYDFSTSNLEIGHTLNSATDTVIVMNTANTLPVNINGTLGVTGSTTSSSKTTGAVTIGGGLGVVGDIHATHVNFEDVEADSVTITDNTTSTSATTGALKVVGGISTQENLNVGAVAKVISETDASSKTTGALIVSGGVGISKNIHALHANFEDVEADSVTITDTTTSTSETTGALKVTGGISTQENLNVGGVAKVISATDASSKTTGALIVTGGVGISKNIHALHANFEDVEADSVTITDATTSTSETTGALKVAGGISTQENLNVGGVAKVISATDASSKTTGALIVTGGVGISKNIHALHANFEDVEADSVTITDTTTSTSVTTGALKVAGGISTQEKLNVGGVTKIWDDTASTSKTSGAVQVVGGLGVGGAIFGNSGNFDGNITVAGDLIVSGNTTSQGQNSLTVSDPTIEVGIGNINGADVGMIMNNPLTGGHKGNVAIIYDFSASNLEIGHTLMSSADSAITMNTANALAVNINGSLGVTGSTTSSSKTTGAVTIGGGVGISGALFGAAATLDGVVTLTDDTTSTSATTGALKVTGGISTQENLNVGGTTDASSKTTGALIVTGGVGISKNIHALHANFEDTEVDSLNVTDTTASSSTTTGAAKIAGGLGVAGNVHSSNIFAGYDLDLTSYAGRAAIGFMGQTNHASFAHIDNNTTVNYAIKQTEGGTTHLNAKDGQHIRLNINNSEKARITSGGNFFVDTDTLYVDAANDRVGINKASPAYALDVDGDINFTGTFREDGNPFISTPWTIETSPDALSYTAGNVGIGAANPEANLHVTGNAFISSTTDATTTVTGALIVAGGMGIAKKIVGQHASFEDVTATSVTASGMVKGATISGTNVYGTLAGANTAAVTTLTASGMVKGATISGTNVYGTLAGANTAAVTTLTASGMVKGATISGTNVYGTLAGANTAAVTTLTASGMVKGATISGTNVYGTLAGSNAAAVTTLSASGVVTLTDTTESTSSTTGALKAAGGVGIAKDVYVGERAYVTGGLITNTGGFGKKTYSYSADLGSGASVANATYVLDFTNHAFHSKVTAMLIESDDEISTMTFDVIGGKIGGSGNSAYAPALGQINIISTSTMNTPWDSTIATSLTGTTVTIKPANACSGVVRFNIFVEYLSHETAGRLTSITNSGTGAGTGDFGY